MKTTVNLSTRIMNASRPFAFAGVSLAAVLALAGITPVHGQAGEPAAEAPIGNPGRVAIEKKMKSIMIPEVNLKDMVFVEAVDAVGTAAKERDASEADPDKKGVKIVVTGLKGSEAPPVTLKLQNVSLGDALKRLADLSNSTLRITGSSVIFAPKEGMTAAAAAPAPESAQAAGRTIIDLVDVEDQPLDSVVDYLNKKSAEKKGPGLIIGEGVDPKATVKELRLKDVTLSEAVFYLSRSIGCTVKPGEGSLSIVPR